MKIEPVQSDQPINLNGPGLGVNNTSVIDLINLTPDLELSFEAFTHHRRLDIPTARRAYRSIFSGSYPGTLLPIARVLPDGDAAKLIFDVGRRTNSDSKRAEPLEIETVILPMKNFHGGSWTTLCVSSQVGCRMGCTFCQTGRMGLVSQLSAGHIVSQVISAQRWLDENRPGVEVKNIVFMGMGEPLDNADAVFIAISRLTEPRGMAYAPARITLSTVGRIDGLKRLATERLPPVRLAISITSADDALRSRLMPINRSMPLKQLRQTLLALPRSSRSRYLIQYVMLKGVNDSAADAQLLADWCRDLPVTVNVIAYNPQDPPVFEASPQDRIDTFMAVLKANGILVKRRATICRSRMGACGQLGNPSLHR